jgi:hypothetical protein
VLVNNAAADARPAEQLDRGILLPLAVRQPELELIPNQSDIPGLQPSVRLDVPRRTGRHRVPVRRLHPMKTEATLRVSRGACRGNRSGCDTRGAPEFDCGAGDRLAGKYRQTRHRSPPPRRLLGRAHDYGQKSRKD